MSTTEYNIRAAAMGAAAAVVFLFGSLVLPATDPVRIIAVAVGALATAFTVATVLILVVGDEEEVEEEE